MTRQLPRKQRLYTAQQETLTNLWNRSQRTIQQQLHIVVSRRRPIYQRASFITTRSLHYCKTLQNTLLLHSAD